MQYESTFNAIDNILRNEAGCSTELDYIEQTSWLLFLKYLDDLEAEREMEALMAGKEYKRIITGFLRWSQWAAPKKADGTPDDINCMTGPDLQQFVDTKLFPALRKFQETAASASTLEYKIGEIFAELRNKITSGYNLREIINLIDSLHFQSAEDKHEMTLLYESKIQRMGNAGRNGGEYYTPRPLIRTIVKVVDPRIGETVYDPACGSAGFLCEAFTYMQQQVKGTNDAKILQENTFYGKEKKPLPYIIATMNMIFHGVAAPNIIRGNTLAENLAQVQEHDRKKVILANPPFGGSERGEVLQNFDLRTSETAYMFMQHFIKMMKTGGRAGIVIKNTFLSNGDASALRKLLLEQCNLHTILDLPSGVFQGAGVKTVVLFFDKGTPTRKIWYYQLNPGRNLGKTNALNEDDMDDFLALQKTKANSENSWTIDVSTLGDDCDLSVNNPNKVKENDERSAAEIEASLVKYLEEAHKQFRIELNENLNPKERWEYIDFKDVFPIKMGKTPPRGDKSSWDEKKVTNNKWVSIADISNNEGKIIEDTKEYISDSAASKIYKVSKGSLLMSFKLSIGRMAFAGDNLYTNEAIIAIPETNKYNLRFLYYYLSSYNWASLTEGKEKVKGATLNKSSIGKIQLPVLSLSEQQQIASRLDAVYVQVDTLKCRLLQAIAECNALKLATLRQVFE